MIYEYVDKFNLSEKITFLFEFKLYSMFADMLLLFSLHTVCVHVCVCVLQGGGCGSVFN